MKSFSKKFIVNDCEILVRTTVELFKGNPTALIVITTYLEANEKIGISPFIEFKKDFCCLYCANKNFETINQEWAERILPKMKEHSSNFSKNLFLKSFHDN